jgi:hypothetical protein
MLGLAKRVGARSELLFHLVDISIYNYILVLLKDLTMDMQDFAHINFRGVWRSSCASPGGKLLGKR